MVKLCKSRRPPLPTEAYFCATGSVEVRLRLVTSLTLRDGSEQTAAPVELVLRCTFALPQRAMIRGEPVERDWLNDVLSMYADACTMRYIRVDGIEIWPGGKSVCTRKGVPQAAASTTHNCTDLAVIRNESQRFNVSPIYHRQDVKRSIHRETKRVLLIS